MSEYDPKTGYSSEDDATCCEDCQHCIQPEDDFAECSLGNHAGPFGGWCPGRCGDFTPLDRPA